MNREIELKIRIGRENGGRNPSVEFLGDDWARDLCGADRVCRSSMENGILLSFLKEFPEALTRRNPDLTKDSLVVQRVYETEVSGKIGWRGPSRPGGYS